MNASYGIAVESNIFKTNTAHLEKKETTKERIAREDFTAYMAEQEDLEVDFYRVEMSHKSNRAWSSDSEAIYGR
jgi:hypothetical protein